MVGYFFWEQFVVFLDECAITSAGRAEWSGCVCGLGEKELRFNDTAELYRRLGDDGQKWADGLAKSTQPGPTVGLTADPRPHLSTSDGDVAAIMAHGSFRRYAAGQPIVQRRGSSLTCFVVVSGVAALQKNSAGELGGSVALLRPNSCLGEVYPRRISRLVPLVLRALVPCEIAVIDFPKLIKLFHSDPTAFSHRFRGEMTRTLELASGHRALPAPTISANTVRGSMST